MTLTPQQVEKIEKENESDPNKAGKIEWFLQGTL
jgi:hypothetical protein